MNKSIRKFKVIYKNELEVVLYYFNSNPLYILVKKCEKITKLESLGLREKKRWLLDYWDFTHLNLDFLLEKGIEGLFVSNSSSRTMSWIDIVVW